ncbi:hypothetical protein [Ornithinimicrobium sp. Y1694]|uniref:hypothetical protein n=1 Tax=Ornithinimicrobium sp. Y1694 TaxID=3418590 RepID=UPI003CEF8943
MKRPVLSLAAACLVLTSCSTQTVNRPDPADLSTQVQTGGGASTTEATTAAVPAPAATTGEDAEGAAGGQDQDAAGADGSAAPATVPAPTQIATPGAAPDPGAAAAALALAPKDTTYLTITDWGRIKARLDAEDLTSDSLQTDLSEFWRAVPGSTVLLTDGLLREENSQLSLRYDVTQDDVRWEVRWSVPDQQAAGVALRMRDDLDLAGLRRAVQDEVPGLEGAELMREARVLLRGVSNGDSLGGDQAVVAAVGEGAESELVVPGCLPWPSALGVDATVEDQESVVDGAGDGMEDLLDPKAWSMAFTGRTATVTVVYPEGTDEAEVAADAATRVALAEGWPTTESVGWSDAFGLSPSGPESGYAVDTRGAQPVATFDYRVVNTTAAATVALAGLVPHGVCAEVDWLAEPTGL